MGIKREKKLNVTNDVKVPLVEKFKELDVGYCPDWDITDLDEMEYGFNGIVQYLEFGECTFPQFAQAVTLIFDIGFKSQFSPKSDDFYGYIQRQLERTILNKLLADYTEDNRKLAADILAVIDVQYKCESREK